MKKCNLLSIFFALLLLLTLSVSAGAVQGILVGPEGLPLEGFSNIYIIDGKPQPIYNFAEHKWYDVFIVGTDENGTPICHVAPDPSLNQEQGFDKGNTEEEFHCFSGTTLVLMADGSAKMIKDIAVGEKVMGCDLAAGRFTTCEVVDNYPTVKSEYYILNGLKVTAGHPFYATNFGPTPASLKPVSLTTVQSQDLKPYATLYGFNPANGSAIKKLTLNSIIHVKESGTFYDLQVDGSMNFFVSPNGSWFTVVGTKIR
jgi:hypothetical protein